MFLRKYWIGLTVFLVVIVGVGLYSLQTRPPKDPIVIYKPVEPIEKPTEQPKAEVPSETDKGGHFHADGTWHEGPHEPVEPPEVNEPILTSAELDALYHQISAEISEMNSVGELDQGLDLSKYSPKQLEHLQKVGIDLSRLPKQLQDKITDHQWKKKGLDPPPTGYTYLQKADGSYLLHKEGAPIVEVGTDTKGNPVVTFSTTGRPQPGETLDEYTNRIAKEVWEKVERTDEER